MNRLRNVALIIFALARAASGEQAPKPPDPNTLIRQSIENYERAWRAGMEWAYTQTDVTTDNGKKNVAVSGIMPLEGTPYERLVSRNGHPLSVEDQRKEERKYEKEMGRRRAESPAERRIRIANYEKERAFLSEVPEAYDFKLVGEEAVGDRPAWVVTLTPRAGFVPASPHAALLKHIDGKLWIDKQDLQWSRGEAHVIDTVSIGLILARIEPGARITIDMSRVAEGPWLTSQITIDGSARIMLVHNRNLDEKLLFTGYHIGAVKSGAAEVAQNGSR